MVKKDILIIGSGIAGLSFALKTAKERPDLSICILTKSSKTETNTRYAQGGIAVVLDKLHDSYEQHINDTLKAGGDLCNKKIVEMVVKKAPKRLNELIKWGVNFDKGSNGQFSVGLEGGHCRSRILHHKDITGFEIEKKLLHHIHQYSNISVLPHHFALDLITGISKVNGSKKCYGAYVLNQQDKKIKTFLARITMLATGGSGQVYKTTTNPDIATGDGVAMAYRANADIKDMPYIQFHPTAFYQKGTKPSFLISEAVRGFGAYIVNKKDKRFLFTSDERGELATRDIVSGAIYSELIKSGEECVYLDCRHLDLKEFKDHFPGIYKFCQKRGINLRKDLIPVAPAAHYQCGGITINAKAQTSITNLYACGECSCSGLHGSNRLASNSLLEAVVFAHEAATYILKKIDTIKDVSNLPIQIYLLKQAGSIKINEIRKEIGQIVTCHAGIIKSKTGLQKAQEKLAKVDLLVRKNYPEGILQSDLWEMKNLLSIAHLIVDQSLDIYYKTSKTAMP